MPDLWLQLQGRLGVTFSMKRIIPNNEVTDLTIEVPEGHRHLRTTLRFRDGSEIVFQEATVAALVRAYTTVKTHPRKTRLSMKGRSVEDGKPGFADWQILEDDSG